MADILSPAELDAIRGRCEAATPGPWEAERRAYWERYEIINSDTGCIAYVNDPGAVDATFIAHARADIPRLLSHVAALGALLATAARELELSCYTDEAVTYQANKQRRLDLAARIRALTPPPTQEPQP